MAKLTVRNQDRPNPEKPVAKNMDFSRRFPEELRCLYLQSVKANFKDIFEQNIYVTIIHGWKSQTAKSNN